MTAVEVTRSVKKAGDFDDLAAEPDRGVASCWWDESWIPFAANGGGDYFCIDLKPARGGSSGQIVSFKGNAGPRQITAKSFSAWLRAAGRSVRVWRTPGEKSARPPRWVHTKRYSMARFLVAGGLLAR